LDDNLKLKKMKAIKFLLIGGAVVLTASCQQTNKKSNEEKAASITTAETMKVDTKVDVKTEPNKAALGKLDEVLSPFEDMTEFALEKNKSSVLAAMNNIEKANGNFEKNLTPDGFRLLKGKIEQLKGFVAQNDFNKVALASSELFKLNIDNFSDAKSVEGQIQIEHLDHMGYKVLALLHQDKVDWKEIKSTINDTEKTWKALSPKVKDGNLKDTFNYLFKGLNTSADTNDAKFCDIMGNMDLTLVDVLEKSI
jgi:hypothetical protein